MRAKKIIYHILLIGTFLTCSTVFANGWTSGGGQLIRTENNSWFIQNTRKVNYCIQIDEQNFGTSLDQAATSIAEAIDYWQRQLMIFNKDAREPDRDGFFLRLGTQEFQRVECSGEVDLTFQMGTLTEEQRRYLVDPPALVGIAVRTDYDKKMLKGKGFIYIAPMHGPLALRLESPVRQLWQMGGGKILSLVMIHELGHVFGMSHEGLNEFDLMNENFPQTVVRWADLYAYYFTIPNYFMPDLQGSFDVCTNKMWPEMLKLNELFSVPNHYRCYQISWSDEFTYHLSVSEKPGAPFEEVATMINHRDDPIFGTLGDDSRLEFYLPQDQKAFPKAKTFGSRKVYEHLHYKAYGTLTGTKSNVKIPAMIRRSHNQLDIVVNDSRTQPSKLRPLISSNLWFSGFELVGDSGVTIPKTSSKASSGI